MVAALCGFPARPRLRPHASPAPARRYERRRPEKTPLHKIVSEHLESGLEWRDQAERSVPGYVEEELRGYPECGILCFGFGRALCTVCGQGVVIAFSCKGRGVCPSRIFIEEIERLLCTAAGSTGDGHRPSAARPRLGAVSFLHRFGSALNQPAR